MCSETGVASHFKAAWTICKARALLLAGRYAEHEIILTVFRASHSPLSQNRPLSAGIFTFVNHYHNKLFLNFRHLYMHMDIRYLSV
jgi:hypothetical protein